MLPSSRRAQGHHFSTLRERSRVVHGVLFSFRYAQLSHETEPSRFSIVVSGAVSKKAVERNLIKRRGRASVAEVLPRVKNGFVGAFFAKKAAVSGSYATVKDEIGALLGRAGLTFPQ